MIEKVADRLAVNARVKSGYVEKSFELGEKLVDCEPARTRSRGRNGAPVPNIVIHRVFYREEYEFLEWGW